MGGTSSRIVVGGDAVEGHRGCSQAVAVTAVAVFATVPVLVLAWQSPW